MPTPCSGEIDRRQAQVDAKIEAIAGSGRFAPGSRGALLHRAPADAGLAQAEFFPTDCSFDHLVDAHEEQGRNCVLWPRAWASSHAWRSRRFLTTDKANYRALARRAGRRCLEHEGRMPVRQPFIEIAGRDRIARTRQLCGLTRFTRDEMRVAGYSDSTPEIDVCAGID